MAPDPKTGIRIVDPDAGKLLLLDDPHCAACNAPAGNAHHVVQKGAPHFGDDVIANLVPICGTGTMRCHGAFHGTPYTAEIRSFQVAGVHSRDLVQRRDQEWVANRLGTHIALHRPDVIDYVLDKLGNSAGVEYLFRHYGIVIPPLGP